jgi:uncharacterized damage-inducible protein DinB
MDEQLVETWAIHNRINLYLLDATSQESLGDSPAKGRTVYDLFAHIHAAAFLGYLISHESHHRGQVTWALKHSGHPLDQKTSYGLWEWGVR